MRTDWTIVAGVAACLIAVLAITGAVWNHAINGQQVTRQQSTQCISAGKTWVQNSSGHFECR